MSVFSTGGPAAPARWELALHTGAAARDSRCWDERWDERPDAALAAAACPKLLHRILTMVFLLTSWCCYLLLFLCLFSMANTCTSNAPPPPPAHFVFSSWWDFLSLPPPPAALYLGGREGRGMTTMESSAEWVSQGNRAAAVQGSSILATVSVSVVGQGAAERDQHQECL